MKITSNQLTNSLTKKGDILRFNLTYAFVICAVWLYNGNQEQTEEEHDAEVNDLGKEYVFSCGQNYYSS